MTGARRPWWRPRLDGLAPRVAGYLSVALLPLGLIALYQTREFQLETEEGAALTLLALTERGAAPLQQELERAFGAGEALARVANLLEDPETCAATLSPLAGEGDPYDFVAIVPSDGPITCASPPPPLPLDDRRPWEELLAPGGPAVLAVEEEGEESLVVAVPKLRVGEAEGPIVAGFVALSIPRSRIVIEVPAVAALRPLRLVTFNAEGQILTSRAAQEGTPAVARLLPPDFAFPAAARGEARLFEGVSAEGEPLVYTVAPVVEGVAYALAVWTPEQAALGSTGPHASPLLFPLLMWGTSLAVAFWAIHRLVIRRVTDVVARMRRFGRDRSLPAAPPAAGAPHELREIEEAFRHMADSILEDEARMDHAFRERGILLREVHHRVKNNLQLISSIISMQMRRVREPEVRALLLRLQDRVLTLASIYRSLYTAPDLGDVNAAPVLRAIVEQSLRHGQDRVDVTVDIEDMVLDPDQVVPLAFLAAEAASNAVTRAAAPPGGRPSVSVTLDRHGERARLEVANSLSGGELREEDPARGLGQHLIHAFAAQVGGTVEARPDDRLFRLSLDFAVQPAQAEAQPA